MMRTVGFIRPEAPARMPGLGRLRWNWTCLGEAGGRSQRSSSLRPWLIGQNPAGYGGFDARVLMAHRGFENDEMLWRVIVDVT